MNGRIYDPRLHRFLQPDNNLQEPYNTQNYNRYGYVLYNPLKYTDPSGEFTWSDLVSGLAIVAGAILVVVGGPAGVLLGYKLIGAGVTHFGATATRLANSGGTWDEASNYVGFNSPTIEIPTNLVGGGKKDVSNRNNPVENHNFTSTSNTGKGIEPKNVFEYEYKYPRTMGVLKQLSDYVGSNKGILKSLSLYSGFSENDVIEKLKFFKGNQKLTIEDLTWHKYHPEGITISSSDIRLEIANAVKLERLNINREIQSQSFFIAVTILHEFVHAGRRENGLNESEGEMGWAWEMNTFNSTITPYNSSNMYKFYNWNFIDPKKQNFKFNFIPN